MNNSVQLDHITNHDNATNKHLSLVYLPARKQATVNHSEEERAATANAAEGEKQVDNHEEEEAVIALQEDDQGFRLRT